MTDEPDPDDEPHLPPPTLWPIGFADRYRRAPRRPDHQPALDLDDRRRDRRRLRLLWVARRHAELRGGAVPSSRSGGAPRRRAAEGVSDAPRRGERFPRNKFLEGATLGLGGVIGGIVTAAGLGFALLPPFIGQKRHEVDLGPVDGLRRRPVVRRDVHADPAEGEVSRRTAFIRNNGALDDGGRCRASRSSRTGAPTSAARCRRTARAGRSSA